MKPTERENSGSIITGLSCPIPIVDYPQVVLAHGGGGRLTRQLIEDMFQPAFENAALAARNDSAVLEIGTSRLAFTTDSHVISPIDFPGGDVGRLAVFGTVNDLAVCGAKPLYLSAGLILEEGFPMDHLWRIVCSMRDAAREAKVQIVTGDTKVVDKGKGDGIYINTSGVGLKPSPEIIHLVIISYVRFPPSLPNVDGLLHERAENQHLSFRRRERAMLRFRHKRSLQKIAAVHATICNLFNSERSLHSRSNFKLNRAVALAAFRFLFVGYFLWLAKYAHAKRTTSGGRSSPGRFDPAVCLSSPCRVNRWARSEQIHKHDHLGPNPGLGRPYRSA